MTEVNKKMIDYEKPKVILCKDCDYSVGSYCHYKDTYGLYVTERHFCGFAKERKENADG